MALVADPMDAEPTLAAAQSVFPDLSYRTPDAKSRGYALLMNQSISESPSHQKQNTQTDDYDRDLSKIYDSGLASYKTKDGDYVLLRATSFGYDDCPHSHDAPLGVLIHLGGAPLVVDSGVGSYTQSESTRNHFRSALGKNTILVNGAGPSLPADWFGWSKTTDCKLTEYRVFDDGFITRGKHNGYSDNSGCHVFVQREVIMLDVGIIAIVDRWDSNRQIDVELPFTIDPSFCLKLAQGVLSSNEQEIHIASVELNSGEKVRSLQNKVPYSSGYGHIHETNNISIRPRPSRRGGVATIFSRLGAMIALEPDRFGFEHDVMGTQLLISDQGVRPMRVDAQSIPVPS